MLPSPVVDSDSRMLCMERGTMMQKHYVRVCARADADGHITPEAFTLFGRTLPITQVLECREARQTRQGGQGARYLIRAGRWQTYLYLDDDRRWYVEEDEHVRQISYLD